MSEFEMKEEKKLENMMPSTTMPTRPHLMPSTQRASRMKSGTWDVVMTWVPKGPLLFFPSRAFTFRGLWSVSLPDMAKTRRTVASDHLE